jgi:hypothetical protein
MADDAFGSSPPYAPSRALRAGFAGAKRHPGQHLRAPLCRSACHPAIIIGKDSHRAGAVLAPNQNIENNPMQSTVQGGS